MDFAEDPKPNLNPEPDRFTKLTSLLHLIGLLNQGDSGYRPIFQAGTPNENLSKLHPLEAIAVILVTRNEATATAYVSDTTAAIIVENAETCLEAAHEGVDVTAPQSGRPLQAVIFSNPAGWTNTNGRSTNSNPHKLRALDIEEATDFWPNVKDDEWYCMFR